MTRDPAPGTEQSPIEHGPFGLALVGAASLLEMVGGGRLICDPRSFPIVLADVTKLQVGGLDNGHWPDDA